MNIHRYTHFALSLPTSTLEIHSWLKINESTDLPIKISALTEVIQLIHTHASGWDGVEQEVKQQSINLSLISRNIVQTGNQIIEYINDMPIIQQIANSIDDLSAEALDGLTSVSYTHLTLPTILRV